jgi:hypothetical protein
MHQHHVDGYSSVDEFEAEIINKVRYNKKRDALDAESSGISE